MLQENQNLLRRLVVTGAILVVAVFVGSSANRVQAACPGLDTSLGEVTMSVSIPETDVYTVWLRLKAAAGNADSVYLEVDGVQCGIVAGNSGTMSIGAWTWVDYRDGNTSSRIQMSLTAGSHSIRLVGREANVLVDKVLFTNDAACTPTGTSGVCGAANSAPSVSSAIDTPDPTIEGNQVQFDVGWTDPDGDQVTAAICKSNVVSAGPTCPGGSWIISPLSGVSPINLWYTTQNADIGTNNYYAFVCDGGGLCSPGTSGTFTVSVAGAPSSYALRYSMNNVRTNDIALDSAILSGIIYVFVSPESNILSVNFWLDNPAMTGSARHTETVAPYDFSGGSVSTANPFDADTLSDGQHSISAKVNLTGGGSEATTATFTVGSLPPSPSNNAPSVSSVTDTPDPATEGNTVQFDVNWSDLDGDQVAAVICQTNAVAASGPTCPGGAYEISPLSGISPINLFHVTTNGEVGTNNYYTFVCDGGGLCSTGISGTFSVNATAPALPPPPDPSPTPPPPPDPDPGPSPSPTSTPKTYTDGDLIQREGDETIYILVDGKRVAIPDKGTFDARRYSWDAVNTLTQAEFDTVSEGFSLYPEGALIRAIGDFDVWIVKYMGTKQFRRLILSPKVFDSYGHLRWEDVLDVEPSALEAFRISSLVRAEGDDRVFFLNPSGDSGSRHWVKTQIAFTTRSYDWDAVYTINSVDREAYLQEEDYN